MIGLAVQCGIPGGQLLAAVCGFYADHGCLVWDGHDVSLNVPAVKPGSLAPGKPGPGTYLPGFGILFSNPQL